MDNTVLTQLTEHLLSSQQMISVAESCTGGLLSASLTELAGSSKWFDRGFVTYSNEAKQKLLDVPNEILLKYGAVSQVVAQKMAEGALKNSLSQIALSVTGVAGPASDNAHVKVGTIWFALARKNNDTLACCHHFLGSRNDIRKNAVEFVLNWLLNVLSESSI